MNKIHLIGNLTRDPELTTTPNHINVCRFNIAVGRKFENSDGVKETDFFNIVAWRGLGDIAYKYLKKGNKACIVGSIQMRSYDDKDGIKRTAVEVVAEDIEFLTPKQTTEKASSIQELEEVEDDEQLPF